MNKAQFILKFQRDGFVTVNNVASDSFVQKCKKELESALDKEDQFHEENNSNPTGYVLSNAKYGGIFWDIFDNPKLISPLEWIMGKNCIVYSYTSSSMPPKKGNPSSEIHVDCPIFGSNLMLRMGMLLALTDFTEENGATRYIAKSHTLQEKPSDNYFHNKSTLLNIKAGSVWFFNTRLWHSGGINKTNDWRHALTLNICHPWMKQYIDLPRLLKDTDISNMSIKAKQKLGFFSQPPTNYNEYYDQQRARVFL